MRTVARSGSRPIIDKLFSLGLDIDPRNSSGATPLMSAAANGKLNALNNKSLRSDFEIQRWMECVAQGCKGGSDVILAKLLSLELDVYTRNNYGSTPVMFAAVNGKFNASCFFSEKGSDLKLRNNDGWTILDRLCCPRWGSAHC